jgi:predicted signal transduction protein with EAL and GGDEF domain
MPALIVSLPPWVGVVALVVATLAVGVSVNFYRTSRRLRERLRQTREASERQADLDAATGLASPRAFARALDLATARADRGEAAVAVVYVGVDDLRVLGNEHGTAVAQQALVALARRLQAVGRWALLALYPQHGPRGRGCWCRPPPRCASVKQARRRRARTPSSSPAMGVDMRQQAELLRDLRQAVSGRQLQLVYQPKVDATACR